MGGLGRDASTLSPPSKTAGLSAYFSPCWFFVLFSYFVLFLQ